MSMVATRGGSNDWHNADVDTDGDIDRGTDVVGVGVANGDSDGDGDGDGLMHPKQRIIVAIFGILEEKPL